MKRLMVALSFSHTFFKMIFISRICSENRKINARESRGGLKKYCVNVSGKSLEIIRGGGFL